MNKTFLLSKALLKGVHQQIYLIIASVSKSDPKKWTRENDLKLLFTLLDQRGSGRLSWGDAAMNMGNQFSSDALRQRYSKLKINAFEAMMNENKFSRVVEKKG